MKNILNALSTAAVMTALCAAIAPPAAAQQTQQKPNVVFILADNVGYGDLGAYGGGELRGRACLLSPDCAGAASG